LGRADAGLCEGAPGTAGVMGRFSVHYFLLFVVMAATGPYFQLILRVRGFSVAQVGQLLGLRSLAGVVGPLVIAHLADRTGRRRWLVIACLAAFALLMVPLTLTARFCLAALLVLAIGTTARTAVPLTDALAAGALADPASQYGKVRVWGSAGFVAALVVIRLLGLVDEGSAASMVRCIMLAAAACMLSAAFLPERQDPRPRQASAARPRAGFDAAFWLFVCAAALHQAGMTAHYSFFTLYLKDVLHMRSAAWVWAIGAGAEMPMLFYAGRLTRRFGLTSMLMVSMGAVTARLLVYALWPSLAVVLAVQLLHALTFGLFHASSIEFLRRKISSERRGLAMAVYASLASAMPAWLASSVGGVLIERWGYSTFYAAYAAAPVLGIGLVLRAGRRMGGEGASQELEV